MELNYDSYNNEASLQIVWKLPVTRFVGKSLYLLTMSRNIVIHQKNNLFCVILGGAKDWKYLGNIWELDIYK